MWWKVTGLRTPTWLWFSRSTWKKKNVPVVSSGSSVGGGKSDMIVGITLITSWLWLALNDNCNQNVLDYCDYDDFYQDYPVLSIHSSSFLTFSGSLSILSKLNTTKSEFDIFLKWSTAPWSTAQQSSQYGVAHVHPQYLYWYLMLLYSMSYVCICVLNRILYVLDCTSISHPQRLIWFAECTLW